MKGISEKKFNEDFNMLCGFYKFHVEKRRIRLKNEDIQCPGIKSTPHSCSEMKKLKWNNIPLNSIEYSSSKESNNVKNLMWAFRCLNAHAENVKEVKIGGIPCYRLEGYSKNNKQHKKLPILMGYVERVKWKPYIDMIMNKITNAEQS